MNDTLFTVFPLMILIVLGVAMILWALIDLVETLLP